MGARLESVLRPRRRRAVRGVLAALLAFCVPMAIAQDVAADSAIAADFNTASAMRTLYPGYDKASAVALLADGSAAKRAQDADSQVSAMLAATYEHDGKQHGVLVVQQQRLHEGEVAWGHADTAKVGVALFTRAPQGWVVTRRDDALFEDGSYGNAPSPALVADGAGGRWLWFTGADSGQGLSYGYGVLVSLAPAGFSVAGRFETGGDNTGACAGDRAEWDELVGPCWSWQVAAELVGVGEREVLLRLTQSGTESDEMGADAKIADRRRTVCYAPRDARAAWVESRCPGEIAWRTVLPSDAE